MDVVRRGTKFELDLTQEDAVGLYAVLTGNQSQATHEQVQKGQMIYTWFFGQVQFLATGGTEYPQTQQPQIEEIEKKPRKRKAG